MRAMRRVRGPAARRNWWRGEAAEFAFEQFGELDRRAIFKKSADDLHPRWPSLLLIGTTVEGSPVEVAIPHQAIWSP